MSAVHQGFGAALENAATEIMRIGEAKGPITLSVKHVDEDGGLLVVQVSRKSDGALVALAEETAVTDEDTAYDGDASELVFTGQALDNTPIVPGSVTIKPTAGGNTVNLVDTNADGILYTDDVDADVAGSVNYFTGDLELSFPSGKDPAATNILADYSYGVGVNVLGTRNFQIQYFSAAVDFETLIVKAAAASSSRVRIEAYQSTVG